MVDGKREQAAELRIKDNRSGWEHPGGLRADGFPLGVSDSEPGPVHDITAARGSAFPALYRAASLGMPALAEPGYDRAGIGVHIPVKQSPGGNELDINTRTKNALLRFLRCLGQRGFALLTGRWQTLQHITASPSRIGDITGAALVLTPFSSTAASIKIAEISSLSQVIPIVLI